MPQEKKILKLTVSRLTVKKPTSQMHIDMKETQTPQKNRLTTISLENPSMLPQNPSNLLSRKDLLITIRYDRVIIFKGVDSESHGRKRDPISDENLKKRKYNGKLSESASKFISKQLTLLHQSINKYHSQLNLPLHAQERNLVFATLTLPSQQVHTDQEIKRKLLVPFIDILKRKFEVNNYFWRAEAQGNGNIHFHLIIDKYCDKVEFTAEWNKVCERLGYVTAFAKKHKHFNPPTCKIEIVKNHKKAIKYCLKYCTKAAEGRPICGKLWGMSTGLKIIRQFTLYCSEDIKNTLIPKITPHLARALQEEHFISLSINPSKPSNYLPPSILRRYLSHLLRVYTYLYPHSASVETLSPDLRFDYLDYREMSAITKLTN